MPLFQAGSIWDRGEFFLILRFDGKFELLT
jgi:hypothetical protein